MWSVGCSGVLFVSGSVGVTRTFCSGSCLAFSPSCSIASSEVWDSFLARSFAWCLRSGVQ